MTNQPASDFSTFRHQLAVLATSTHLQCEAQDIHWMQQLLQLQLVKSFLLEPKCANSMLSHLMQPKAQ